MFRPENYLDKEEKTRLEIIAMNPEDVEAIDRMLGHSLKLFLRFYRSREDDEIYQEANDSQIVPYEAEKIFVEKGNDFLKEFVEANRSNPVEENPEETH